MDTKSFPLSDSEQRFCFSKLARLIFRYKQSHSKDDEEINAVVECIINVPIVCVCVCRRKGGGMRNMKCGSLHRRKCGGRFVRTEGCIEGDDWRRWIGKETGKKGWWFKEGLGEKAEKQWGERRAKEPVTGIVQRRCPRQGCLTEMP